MEAMAGMHPPWRLDAENPGFGGIVTIIEWIYPGDLALANLFTVNMNLLWGQVLFECPHMHGQGFHASFRTLSQHGRYPYRHCMLEVYISETERIPALFWMDGSGHDISPR